MYYGECEVHNLQWFEKVDECPACKLAAELAAQTAVIEAARYVNEWLIRNGLEGTAHQKHLTAKLAKLDKVTK